MFKKLKKFISTPTIISAILLSLGSVALLGETVAITQITSHKALDSVRRGVVDELREKGYEGDITFANPQGDIATAVQIAKKFASERPDVIVAITTPSAQTVVNAARGESIPVVFATVTDPVGAKLVSNLERPGGNVTGTMNRPPIDRLISLMKEVMPGLKRIGVVLNYGEANTVALLKEVREKAKKKNIKVVAASADNSADVQNATRRLVGKVDCLLLLENNTVASGLSSLLKVAHDHKIPVFSSFVEAVEQGATLGLAFDEYAIGRQTGAIVYRILNGENPGNIAVKGPDKIVLAINKKELDYLGVNIDKSLYEKADVIY